MDEISYYLFTCVSVHGYTQIKDLPKKDKQKKKNKHICMWPQTQS